MGLLSKARVGVKKADIWAGSKIFKSNVGFMNNVSSAGKIVKKAESELIKKNPQLYDLITNGFVKFENSYDTSLIKKLEEKFNAQMKDDRYSFAYSGYEGKTYKRELINPAINFPELSELITEDVIKTAEGYYSNGCFTINHIGGGQNFSVPEEIQKSHEMFSNFWHFDFNKTSELKYFVYLSDVTEKDGPFHAQTKARTKELIDGGFKNRNKYNIPLDVLEDPEHVHKMMGPTGTSFFGHPAVILHRAGVPDNGHSRNLIQFLLGPAKEKLPKDWLKNVVPHASQGKKYDPANE